MQTGGMLQRLLLAGTFLCVCGTPVYLPDLTPTQDSDSELTTVSSLNIDAQPGQQGSSEHVMLNVGPDEGGADPNGRHRGPDGIEPVTQADFGDGPWRGVKRVRQMGETEEHFKSEESDDLLTATGGEDLMDMDSKLLMASPTAIEKTSDDDSTEMSWPAPLDTSSPAEDVPKLTPQPGVFIPSQMSTIQDPMLPEIAPLPKEDGPESLWTEAARPSGADTMGPLSQDEATEGTMSSESLPLIFEPFEDVGTEGVTPLPGSARPIAAMATDGMPQSGVDTVQLVTVETDAPPPLVTVETDAPPRLVPEWTSPWQASGTELREPISSSDESLPQQQVRPEAAWEEAGTDAVRTSNLDQNSQTTGPAPSSIQASMTTVTMTTHRHGPKSRSGLQEMESEEEQDEDEEDENSEESVEDSEELTEAPNASSTAPPYSLIPPPPVWVQRNQGLMRSWVELIREKAGYVSGMLAPVGIGITGALLIVGALYSIRMIHRKRRNSFKHQRRKVRQPEQPREPGTSRQDQAMLLADSSEDEF